MLLVTVRMEDMGPDLSQMIGHRPKKLNDPQTRFVTDRHWNSAESELVRQPPAVEQ